MAIYLSSSDEKNKRSIKKLEKFEVLKLDTSSFYYFTVLVLF